MDISQEDSYFGINGVSAFHQRQALNDEIPRRLKILQDLDIHWERGDFWWHVLEPKEGEFDWTFSDAMLDVFEAHGIQYFPILNYSSAWARGDGYAPANEMEWRQFGEYVYQVVNRYKDRMKYWEVWNEPNILPFWRPVPKAEDYAELLQVAYTQAKKADPDCVIVAPCTAGFDRNFVERIYQAGAKDYFDIFSWHYYSIVAPEKAIRKEIQDIRNLMSKYGDGDKDIWITEMGVTSHPNRKMGVPEDEQAHLLVRHYLTNLAAGVSRVFWFTLIDWTDNPDDERWDAFLGLQRTDRTDKPSYKAMKTLVQVIDGAEYVGDPKLDDSIHTSLWKNDEGYILVAYCNEDEERTIQIPASKQPLVKVGINGKRTSVSCKNGVAALPVDMTPAYFIGVNEDLEFRASFQFKPDWVRLVPEQKQEVQLCWNNPSDEPNRAEVQIRAPEGWTLKPDRKVLTIGARSTAAFPILFQALPADAGKEFTIRAMSIIPGKEENYPPLTSSLRVVVDEAASIRIRPLIEGESLVTNVSVGNNLSKNEDGKLVLDFPWERASKEVDLEVGKRIETTFTHDLADLRRQEHTRYILGNLDMGWGWSPIDKEFGLAVIPKRNTPIEERPDGDPTIRLRNKHRVEKTPFGDDYRADLWFQFTNDRLYFYGEFRDSSPAMNPFQDEDVWRGDCLELYLGFDGPEDAPYYSKKDYQVIASTGQKGEGAHIFCWPAMKRVQDANLEVDITDSGYIFKGAIPLSTFEEANLKDGSIIGFDVSVHDYSPETEAVQSLMWNGTGANWQTPRDWGIAVIRVVESD